MEVIGVNMSVRNIVRAGRYQVWENGSNDFDETCSECRTNQYWTACENRMSKKIAVLEIFIHKVQIFGQKWQKWCLKKARYLKNGKCYWKSDLIFRICDKLHFLYVWSDFCLVFVFREKIWLENGQFSCIFWMIFGIFLPTTLKILMKLGQKWDKMDIKQPQKTRGLQIEPFWRYLASK